MPRPEWLIIAREEFARHKSDFICKLMPNCQCPGDRNGCDPEQAICFRVADLIDQMLAQNIAAAEKEKNA